MNALKWRYPFLYALVLPATIFDVWIYAVFGINVAWPWIVLVNATEVSLFLAGRASKS